MPSRYRKVAQTGAFISLVAGLSIASLALAQAAGGQVHGDDAG